MLKPRLPFAFSLRQFFCTHQHMLQKYDFTGDPVSPKHHYLECFDCLKQFPIAWQFTVATGVYARIEDMLLNEEYYNTLRANAREYWNEMGIEI